MRDRFSVYRARRVQYMPLIMLYIAGKQQMEKRIQSYIEQFTQLFNGHPWLDETFSKKLDDLGDEQVFIEAPNNNHCVAQVISHLTEWRKEYLRRLANNSPERMLNDDSPNNWFSKEHLKKTGWAVLYGEFKQTQQQLVELLQSKSDDFLDEPLAGTDHNKEYYVAGLLHHDAYHLGQIGLILKWAK